MVTVYGGEVYKCNRCKIFLEHLEVFKTWKCPNCLQPVNIKVEVGGNWHTCLRLQPHEMKIGQLLTFERLHVHQILAIITDYDNYILALKEYGRQSVRNDDFFLIIDGAWIDS